MKIEEFCHEFHQVDLRLLENCLKVTANCNHGKSSYRFSTNVNNLNEHDNIIIFSLQPRCRHGRDGFHSFESISAPI